MTNVFHFILENLQIMLRILKGNNYFWKEIKRHGSYSLEKQIKDKKFDNIEAKFSQFSDLVPKFGKL